jgi:hypothetical protein
MWPQRGRKAYDFQDRSHSAVKAENLRDIKNKFVNITDEHTIDVHKRLEELIRKRTTSCLVKYSGLDFKQRGLNQILKKMNASYHRYQALEDTKNSPTPKFYQWYVELETLVENYFSRDDLVLGKLLDRLIVYGKVCAVVFLLLLFFPHLKIINN